MHEDAEPPPGLSLEEIEDALSGAALTAGLLPYCEEEVLQTRPRELLRTVSFWVVPRDAERSWPRARLHFDYFGWHAAYADRLSCLEPDETHATLEVAVRYELVDWLERLPLERFESTARRRCEALRQGVGDPGLRATLRVATDFREAGRQGGASAQAVFRTSSLRRAFDPSFMRRIAAGLRALDACGRAEAAA